MMPLTPFESALVIHLVADWLLQNEWMAVNKVRLSHPAAWVHGGIHGVLLGFVLGWKAGLVLGLVHTLVDTRVPLLWWVRVFKRCQGSPDLSLLLIGCDQVIHIGCIASWLALAR
jgi:hypothetical protein